MASGRRSVRRWGGVCASSASSTATSCAACAVRRSEGLACTPCLELPSRSRCTWRPMCCSARRTAMTARAAERADVLLVRNPHSSKSPLFSRLTGIAQKVANYPGVTTEVRSGHAGALVIHDYPGIYSLEPLTLDERVAIQRLEKALAEPKTKAIVCVLDATRLERSLYLLLELLPRAPPKPRPPLCPPPPPRLERSLYLLLELLPRARAVHVPVVAAVNVIDEL